MERFLASFAIAAIAAMVFATIEAKAELRTGKPEGSPHYRQDCAGGCPGGALLADEDWTDTPCGPEAIVNAMRIMCDPKASATRLWVNPNPFYLLSGTRDAGLGVRDLADLVDENFNKDVPDYVPSSSALRTRNAIVLESSSETENRRPSGRKRGFGAA